MHRHHQAHAKRQIDHAPKNARHIIQHVHGAAIGFSERLDELIVKFGILIAGKLYLVGMLKDLQIDLLPNRIPALFIIQLPKGVIEQIGRQFKCHKQYCHP